MVIGFIFILSSDEYQGNYVGRPLNVRSAVMCDQLGLPTSALANSILTILKQEGYLEKKMVCDS